MGDRSSVASLHHSTNANSYSESIDFERGIVLGWVNILGVEVSVKLDTPEPRSVQSRAFLSGVKGKVPPGTSVRRSISREDSKRKNQKNGDVNLDIHLGVPLGKA